LRDLVRDGTTIILTTQYLEEADRLADDIVVLDHGRVAARGTPAELKRLVGGKVVTVTIPAADLDRLTVRPDLERPAGTGHVTVTFGIADADGAAELVARLADAGIAAADLHVASPSLDDVFAHLTLSGARS
jgi:ABC-2 type transport system ATP-binding protein